jgi:hypothetical protein
MLFNMLEYLIASTHAAAKANARAKKKRRLMSQPGNVIKPNGVRRREKISNDGSEDASRS